ncbi:D-alanyl-D-alanine carboxypeptidase family protein [Candidatus Pacearchaeota archaeon]|nr:D-alanyl-D-alanine carboxypeptidase family protein [Candidatus Pacearchaeota archaeon]
MAITTDTLIKGIIVLVVIGLVGWGLFFLYNNYIKPYFEGIPDMSIDSGTNEVIESVPGVDDEIIPPDTLSTECSGVLVSTGYSCGRDGCKVRESVLPRLQEAVRIAQSKGVTLRVNSAWRSASTQQQLYSKYQSGTGAIACGPGKDNFAHCPHVVGCAVDVSATRNNKKISASELESIMYQAGFIRFCKETWHFEYGTVSWQRTAPTGRKCY